MRMGNEVGRRKLTVGGEFGVCLEEQCDVC